MKVNLYISMYVVLVDLVIYIMFISFASTVVDCMHFLKVHCGNTMIALVQFVFSAPFYGIFTCICTVMCYKQNISSSSSDKSTRLINKLAHLINIDL